MANWQAHNSSKKNSWKSAPMALCHIGNKPCLTRSFDYSRELLAFLFGQVTSLLQDGCRTSKHHILTFWYPKQEERVYPLSWWNAFPSSFQ